MHECRVGSGEDSVQLFQMSGHSYKQHYLVNASQQDLVLNRSDEVVVLCVYCVDAGCRYKNEVVLYGHFF